MVERIPEHGIFVAGIYVWIVVDFNDVEAVSDLLDVHAVKSIPDEIGRAQRNRDELLGSLVEGDRFGRSFAQLVLLLVALDDLPVPQREAVARHKQRAPVQYANSPV